MRRRTSGWQVGRVIPCYILSGLILPSTPPYSIHVPFIDLLTPTGASTWLGLSAPKHNCDWQWTDGSALDYKNFINGNSTDGCDAAGGNYCATMSATGYGEWTISNCQPDSTPTSVVCEAAPQSNQI